MLNLRELEQKMSRLTLLLGQSEQELLRSTVLPRLARVAPASRLATPVLHHGQHLCPEIKNMLAASQNLFEGHDNLQLMH